MPHGKVDPLLWLHGWCCFQDIRYVEGSQRPYRPECRLVVSSGRAWSMHGQPTGLIVDWHPSFQGLEAALPLGNPAYIPCNVASKGLGFTLVPKGIHACHCEASNDVHVEV